MPISRRCAAMLFCSMMPLSVFAGDSRTRLDYEPEYRIKAACLYGFAKFIEWPKSDNAAPFTIGILGHDPFAEVIDKLVRQKTVNGRAVVVRRLHSVEEAREYDLVYLGSPEMLTALLRAVEHSSVLTVGETEQFTIGGGMIGFVVVDDNVRFDINTENASKAGLVVSSRLLQLARTVILTPQGKP